MRLMHGILLAGTVLASATAISMAGATPATADDLVQMQANPANVVMPTITYDARRHLALDHINGGNVGKLQVA